MTSLELEKLIKDRLASANLGQHLDDRKEQYLEFPDGFFAEIVLKDGSRLTEAQKIVKGVKEDLRKQGVELDAIVRANWGLVEVVHVGPAVAKSGGVKDAARFIATLQSGERKIDVIVDLTGLAFAQIEKRLSEGKLAGYSTDESAACNQIVTDFLLLELSHGGESYWDPVAYPELELNDAALLYLLTHGRAKAS